MPRREGFSRRFVSPRTYNKNKPGDRSLTVVCRDVGAPVRLVERLEVALALVVDRPVAELGAVGHDRHPARPQNAPHLGHGRPPSLGWQLVEEVHRRDLVRNCFGTKRVRARLFERRCQQGTDCLRKLEECAKGCRGEGPTERLNCVTDQQGTIV